MVPLSHNSVFDLEKERERVASNALRLTEYEDIDGQMFQYIYVYVYIYGTA